MSKIVTRTNFRVVAEVYEFGKPDANWSERKANSIKEQIKRHIDDIGQVYIEYDTNTTCSHCGYEWEVDPETKEPLCCSKAQQEFEQEK